jgi:hypothetical protein
LTKHFSGYIHWTFQTELRYVIYSLTAIFYIFTTIWALVIAGIGWWQPVCLYVGDKNFETSGSNFIDAFAISWTTFSTVVSITNY